MDKYIKVGIGVMILDGNKILLGHRAKDKNNPASWKTMEALGGVNIREFFDNENAHCIVKDYEIKVNESIRENSEIYEQMIDNSYKI